MFYEYNFTLQNSFYDCKSYNLSLTFHKKKNKYLSSISIFLTYAILWNIHFSYLYQQGVAIRNPPGYYWPLKLQWIKTNPTREKRISKIKIIIVAILLNICL